MADDASATFRAYRKQALYVLWRLLTDESSESRIYNPEAAEDLAVFDLHQNLIEAVQVKDYVGDLALSHLKPKSQEGFFARLLERKANYPRCTPILASFGKLGPELKGAIEGDGKARKSVAKKLSEANSNISEAEACSMLDALRGNVTHPEEFKIK